VSGRRGSVAGVVVAALALAGCGHSQGYGGKDIPDLAKNVNNKLALGATTTTVGAATAPTGKQTVGSTAPPTTARVTNTTAAPAVTNIAIVKDAAGYFDPQGASVYKGSTVVWTNRDVVPRSVQATNYFTSPTLAPGQTFSWVANVTGTINYTDGTRPYAGGILQVVAR